MGEQFAVDLDGLDELLGFLSATEAELAQVGRDVDRRVGALQEQWDGLAADAQAAAHAEWVRGLARMHEALVGLRAAGRNAETGYRAAAEANLSLWKQVSR